MFETADYQPLAARMRPQHLNDFVGQAHILGPEKPLRQAIENGHLHSMILWGPPGTGKTTLANVIAHHSQAQMISLSAIMAGVRDIRQAMQQAQDLRQEKQQATILFIDEIHRFNKAQQDAFLPYVENGTVTLIGATTENPSFELNNALLSRARVYVLKSLDNDALVQVITQALSAEQGLANYHLQLTEQQQQWLIKLADGDARRALNMLEILADLSTEQAGKRTLHDEDIKLAFAEQGRQFDKGGDVFYEQISALHKSVRGSSPDAALYWLARMLDGGCDPLYIARRVIRMATEDIGNADPRALNIAMTAWDVQTRLGSPEGELAIAQAIIYLAVAAKSNAVYTAFNTAMVEVKQQASLPVPMHLRNAPTQLMKNLGMAKNYRYAHDEQNAYAAGEQYFPDDMTPQVYYHPVNRGLEIKIAAKLKQLRELDQAVLNANN